MKRTTVIAGIALSIVAFAPLQSRGQTHISILWLGNSYICDHMAGMLLDGAVEKLFSEFPRTGMHIDEIAWLEMLDRALAVLDWDWPHRLARLSSQRSRGVGYAPSLASRSSSVSAPCM